MANPPNPASFPARLAALQAKYPNPREFEAAYAYLDLETDWAAALEATDKPSAIQHLAAAEKHQITIGSYATGSGEGLESMDRLHDLMRKRAKLEEKCADDAQTPVETRQHLERAQAILREIDRSPNKPTGGGLAQALQRIAARIAQL
jgi:hypothetical protein